MAGRWQRMVLDGLARRISDAYWAEIVRLRPWAADWGSKQFLEDVAEPHPKAPFGAYENFSRDGEPLTEDGLLRLHRVAWSNTRRDVKAIDRLPTEQLYGIEQAHLASVAMRYGFVADDEAETPHPRRTDR